MDSTGQEASDGSAEGPGNKRRRRQSDGPTDGTADKTAKIENNEAGDSKETNLDGGEGQAVENKDSRVESAVEEEKEGGPRSTTGSLPRHIAEAEAAIVAFLQANDSDSGVCRRLIARLTALG